MHRERSADMAQARRGEQDTERNGFELGRDDAGAIVIRIVPPAQGAGASPLIALEALGLEKEAARKLRSMLPCVKLGRRWYAKRSDVGAMFDRLATLAAPRAKPVKVRAETTTETLASIATAERRRGAR